MLPSSANFSKRRTIRNDATSFQGFPGDYPGCLRTNLTQLRNVQEDGLTDFEDHVKQTKIGPRHLVDVKLAINSLHLEQNKTMKVITIGIKLENLLNHSAVAVSFSSSLLEVGQDERPQIHDVHHDLQQRQRRQLPVKMARQKPKRDINQLRCSAFSDLVTLSSVMQKGSKTQRWKEKLFAGFAS